MPNNFIESVKFNTDFPPFKGGDKIFFGGKKQVNDLIKFYLKNKGVENYVDNAKRFKINCVLGNNGGGKSRLFEGIVKKEENLDIDNIDGKEIVLDDFFVFGKSFHYIDNVNSYLYRFLGANIKLSNKNERHISIYNYVLIFNFFFKERYNLSLLDVFLGNILNKKYFVPNNEKLFKNNFVNKIKLRDATGYTVDQFELFLEVIQIFNEFINNYSDRGNNDDKQVIILKCIFGRIGNLKIRNNLISEKYGLNNINIESSIFDELNNNIKIDGAIINLDNFFIFIKNNLNLTISQEVLFSDFIADIFNIINISFDDSEYNFNSLSSGEKLIFLRFTNIYMKIIEDFELFKNKLKKDGKTDEEINKIPFEIIILIDEPDLHLHLDWQKQYIQKLIDVFSTLDTNIKLHFIIATHSPFIISDLPNESIVVLDGKGSNTNKSNFTKIKTYDGLDFNEGKIIKTFDEYNNYFKSKDYKGEKTFGANFVDIINDGFFFDKKVLMGSFAEENIKKFSIAQKFLMVGLDNIKDENLGDEEKKVFSFLKDNNITLEKFNKDYIDNIGDNFLKENLLYL